MAEQTEDPQFNQTPYTPLGVEDDNAKNKESSENALLQQIPVIKHILRHLDIQIDKLQSIENIPADLQTDPEKFMHLVSGRRHAVTLLRKEKDYLQNKIKAVVSKQ